MTVILLGKKKLNVSMTGPSSDRHNAARVAPSARALRASHTY
jgi:hypothetical protein